MEKEWEREREREKKEEKNWEKKDTVLIQYIVSEQTQLIILCISIIKIIF